MSNSSSNASPSSSSALSRPSTSTEDIHEILISIQRDPVTAAKALPSLSESQLLSLFSLFNEDEDITNASGKQRQDQTGIRSSAYLALSTFVNSQRNPQKGPNEPPTDAAIKHATQTLSGAFAPTVDNVLRGTNVQHITSTLSFLSAFFQVDAPAASAILLREGNVECTLDIIDLAKASSEKRNMDKASKTVGIRLERALVNLLSQALGHAECRKILTTEERIKGWLRSRADDSNDATLQAAAALALVKVLQGGIFDTEATQSGIPVDASPSSHGISEVGVETSPDALAKLLERAVLVENSGGRNTRSTLDAVEGLAYLSVHPSVREYIVSQPSLLQALYAIGARSTKKVKPSTNISASNRLLEDQVVEYRANIGLHYGLALTFANICQYRPKLSKEEEQIAKLRRMTKVPNAAAHTGESNSSAPRLGMQDEGEDVRTSDEAVRVRIRKLCTMAGSTGFLALLAGLARSESKQARACTARAYLAVVEDVRNRGAVLQSGGGRALLDLIKAMEPLVPDWIATQALSKLAITASPLQVFGANIGSTHDAIPVLCRVLTVEGSTPARPISLREDQLPNNLQKFEALMALTNIAYGQPEMAARIAKVPGMWTAVEGLLLHDHELLRRAAVEMICNLVVCDEGFERFVPTTTTTPKVEKQEEDGPKSAAESRLQVLVALADVDDLPTRKAASGALAIVSSDERVCGALVALERRRGNMLGIIGRLLIDDEETDDKSPTGSQVADRELVHRGVVILRNLAVHYVSKHRKSVEDGFVQALAARGIVDKVQAVVKDCMQRGERDGPVMENAVEFVMGLKSA